MVLGVAIDGSTQKIIKGSVFGIDRHQNIGDSTRLMVKPTLKLTKTINAENIQIAA